MSHPETHRLTKMAAFVTATPGKHCTDSIMPRASARFLGAPESCKSLFELFDCLSNAAICSNTTCK